MNTLFATNRVLNEGLTPRNPGSNSLAIPRKISFNLDNNQAEQSIYFCNRTSEGNYQEIGNQEFFKLLDESTVTDILFYIHGYSSLPEKAVFRRTEELQNLFDKNDGNKVLVVPLIWPCDNDFGFVIDYFDDKIAADDSDTAFMRFIEKFFAWLKQRLQLEGKPFNKKLHILTQSMGARVLVGAIDKAVEYYQINGFPQIFSNIFLAAPDIVNESLEPGKRGQWTPFASQNVIIYHAFDDWALTASIGANAFSGVFSKRLGQLGPEDISLLPDNVFALDCSEFNNLIDTEVGHRYFGSLVNRSGEEPGLLFKHMQLSIERKKVVIPSGARTAVLNQELLDNHQN